MKAGIKIHFPGCKQTEVFVSPLERALDCEGSSEGKSCKMPPRKPKGFHSKLSRKTFYGKQNRGTWRWFVFFACWLKKYSWKCHSTFFSFFFFFFSHFLKTTNKQKNLHQELPYVFPHGSYHSVIRTLNKNDQCISFCFQFEDTNKRLLSPNYLYWDRQHLCRATKSTDENGFLPSEQNPGHRQGLTGKLPPTLHGHILFI